METKDFAGLCSIIILALGIVGISAADVPTRIHYQGVLSDASGPIDGDVNLTVELYAVTVPGGRAILVWSDTQVTAVANGVYSAWIEGTTTNPFPGGLFTNPEVYISVLAGSERILPLTELGTVPYAFRADTAADAETLDGHVPDDFIPAGTDDRVDESGDTMTGPLSVGGEVESTIDGFRFPDGSVQTTAASEANNIKGALDAMAELLGEPDFMKSFPSQTASLYTCTPDEAPRMTLEALGGPVGGVTGMIGWDGISHNFTYLLAVQSAFPDLLEDEYLRQDGTLTITGAISNARIRGVITGFGLAAWDGRTATYVAKFEPFLSFLDYTVDYRTHQNLSVSDIVRGVLQRYFPSSRYSFLLSERYDPLPFEIMYGERVGDYMRRLLEKAGIHYHFASDGDSVVISDTNTGFSTSGITLPYHGHLVRPEGGAFIGTLSRRKALYTGSATIRGYNFENSLALIEGTANSGGVGEYYEYDTRIAEEAYAITQAEIEQARLNVKAAAYYGTSNYAGLKAGHTINISGIGGAFSGEYLVKQVRHVILSEENGYCVQANAFRAIRSDVTYRPPRRVPVPRISGLVSAKGFLG